VSFFPHDIFKPDAAKITKLGAQMLQDESRKTVYLSVKRSTVKVTSYNNSAGVGLCILVSAGFL